MSDGLQGSDLELFERSVGQATERHTGADLDTALTDLGWLDALSMDPRVAVATLFARQGAANVTSSALSRVVAHGLGLDPPDGPAVVLPPLSRWDRPGTVAAGGLSVSGLSTAALTGPVLVAAGPDLVAADPASMRVRPVQGVDPGYGLVELSGDRVPFEPFQPGQSGAGPGAGAGAGADRWADAVALAQVAVGYELTGAARSMLGLAREHALDRVQFGQPIARFQAVRHRLAEALVAIESAEAVLEAYWEFPGPQLAAVAKSLAGRGARTAARHCQQVLAGIGFTAEHPFHHHFKRVLLLDQLFGSAHRLTEEWGRELLAARALPDLLPL